VVPLTICHVDDLPPLVHAESRPDGADGPGVAVVIDVIRAFTVAPWCLARGAAALFLAPSVEVAARARAERYPEAVLLKDGPPDPRFALPNSPSRVARTDLTGQTVIQKTGNGTRGAFAVGAVPLVLCASFVTAGATARKVAASDAERVLLVPTEGDEDLALAEYLAALLVARAGSHVDPEPYLARVRDSAAAKECLERSDDPAYPGVCAGDLESCLDLDGFGHALRARRQGDLLSVIAC
jgi:2-phosphosulfolactate phosphatase